MAIFQRRGAWVLSGCILFAMVCGVSAPALALPPTIGAVSPSSGTYAISPSASITISGADFQLGATITVGSLSGATVAGSTATAATPFVYVSATQLRFYWPNTGLAPGVYDVQVTNSPTESAVFTGGFTVQAPQPTVSSLSPNVETYGVSPSRAVTIFGTNFVVGATTTVGSLSGATVAGTRATAATPFVFVSSSRLSFYWPNTSLVPGSYTVTVTNPVTAGGGSASLADGFAVVAPQPTVSSLSPNVETYGVSPSEAVTIFGTNFVVGATITVGSLSGATVAGTSASAATPFVFVSGSRLSFYWPNTSLPPGSYEVAVTNPAAAGGLSGRLANGFAVAEPQPTVSSLSSSGEIYGVSPSRAVTIYGTNFVVGATITVGSLTGATVAGTSASATTPFVFVTSSRLSFYWPNTSLPPGSYEVAVTNPAAAGGLSGRLANGFVVTEPQLTISSVSPTPVTYGISVSQGITIYGSNFVVGATITVGSLTGPTVAGTSASAATPFVFVTSSRLSFYWPNTSLPPGSYEVAVTNPAAAGGLSGRLANGFAVAEPQPTVSSLSPNVETYGVSPSEAVTIYGASFVVGATITVGSLTGPTVAGTSASAATPFVFVSGSRLSFYWPNTSLPPGSYEVAVTNPAAAGGLSGSLTDGFAVTVPQPTITAVSPTPVEYDLTTSRGITIFGSNFVVGGTIAVGSLSGATVAGTSATAATPFVFVTSSRLSFYWPNTSLAPGSYTVAVTNPASAGGLPGSLPNAFTVSPPVPIVQSVTPSTVEFAVTPSQSVTVTGSKFYIGTDGPVITVGTFTCMAVSGTVASPSEPCVYVSNTRLEFYWDNGSTSPGTAMRPGSYAVQVTNPAFVGAATGSLPGGFSIVAPQPHIERLTPAVVTAGITTSRAVTIVGFSDSGFLPGADVVVGNLSCVAVENSTPTSTTPCVFVSPTQIKFFWDTNRSVDPTAPLLGPGTYDVRVTNPAARGGLSDTLPGGFRVTVDPEILGVEPSAGIGAGARGAVVTISSAGFGAGASVRIGTSGVQDSAITLTSGFRANAEGDGGTVTVNVADTAVPGFRDVTLTAPNGFTSGCPTCRVMINPPPVVASVSPALGVGSSGMSLTVSGGNFAAGALVAATVTLPAGVTGACTVTNGSAIACANVAVAPGVLPGNHPVIVTNPDGGWGSGLMTINAGPTVSALTPASGNPGTTIALTIVGAGFQSGVGIAFDSGLAVSGLTRIDAATLSAQLTVATSASEGYHALTVINPDGGRITADQAFYVGTPPADLISAIASYGQQGVAAVQYQRWTGGAWSSNLTGPSLSAPPVWQVMKANPIRDERVLAVVDEQRRLTLHVWNGQSWLGGLQAAASTGLARPTQTVDVAFEQVSGRGMAVYGTTNSTTLRYRIWDGTSWSAEALIEDFVNGQMTGGLPLWVRLESRPGTNDLVLVYEDLNDDIAAVVWNGTTNQWSDSVLLTTNAAGHDAPIFDVAFERLTGRAMALWATATAGTQGIPRYRIWNSGWGGEAAAPSAAADVTHSLTALRLVGDPSSNRLALAASSGTTSPLLTGMVWTGSEWPTTGPRASKVLTANLVMGGGGRGFDVGWEGVSGDAVAVYGATGSPLGFSRTWSASAPLSQDPWSAESVLPVPPLVTPAAPAWIELAGARGGDGLGLGVLFDTVGIVALARWDGALWGGATVAQNLASGLVSSVTGRAIAISLAQHLAGSGPVITPPPPATDTTAPATPAVAAGVLTATSVSLSWTAVGDDGLAGGMVSRYELRRTLGTVTSIQAITPTQASGGTETVTVTALRGGSAYTFELRALDEIPNASGWSAPVTVTTPVDQSPPAITDLRLGTAAPTANTVSVQWTAPIDDSGPLAGYLVRYSASTPFSFDTAMPYTLHAPQSSGTTASLIIDGLVPGTIYHVAVKAMDAIGQLGALSNVLDASTAAPSADTTAPAPIADLAVFPGSTTSASLLLTWTATGDDISVGTASAYEVRYATFPLTTVNFSQGTVVAAGAPGPSGHAQELLVAGLTSNTNYYFAIVAIDDGSNRSGLSNVAAGRTALRLSYTLVSVPRILAVGSDTADVVFGDDVGVPSYVYHWNPSGPLPTDGCYEGTVSTPSFPTCGILAPIQPGSAYYLRSAGTQAVLDAPGTPVSNPTFDVPLELGFNMIGNPYEQDILLSQVQVRRSTGAPVSYQNAVTNGWVAPAIYLYDGVTTQPYGLLTSPPAAFKPWSGAWVQSLVSDAVLVFTRP